MKTKLPSVIGLHPLSFLLLAALSLIAPGARAQTVWSGALSLDGVDDYVDVPDGAWFVNEFTVEAWVYVRSCNKWSRVIDFGNGYASDNLILGLSSGTSGRPIFEVWAGGSTSGTVIAPDSLPTNQWVHLAATLGGNKGILYVNGLEAGSATMTLNALNRTNNFIGRSNWTSDAYANAVFDEVRIWSVARTGDQIREGMCHPLNGTEANLVGYYRFDEGSGHTVQDATSNDLDGLLVNGPSRTNSTIPAFVSVKSGLPAVSGASAAWGDYDNDGRLDILLAGYTGFGGSYISQVWRNTGNGFENVTATVAPGLPGVFVCSVAWGDYDNDGGLDFLLAGRTMSGRITQIWRNTGGAFVNMTATLAPGLPGLEYGSLAWGDYDNDGRLDILLVGQATPAPIAQVWRNTGSGFTNINTALPGVQYSFAAWGDYDNDGRLDILMTGYDASHKQITQIWRNTGNRFDNVTATMVPGLPEVFHGPVAWGDYDNDGRLDIVLTGLSERNPYKTIAQVWRNTGTGFTNINAGLPGISMGSITWGDYDNDGRPDILLMGNSETYQLISQVRRNTGAGFTNINAGLQGVYQGSIAWGDYDSDGRLDILQVGGSGDGNVPYARIWRNIGAASNTRPEPPIGLTASGDTLSWNPASDAQTPENGLSYNIRIGTTNNVADIVSPHAALDSGVRRVPALGNAEQGPTALACLPFGIYYWSVQAVDTSFAGSAFAPEQRLVIAAKTLPATEIGLTSARLNGSIHPLSRPTSAWFEWGETTDYGHTTPVLLEDNGANPLPVSCLVTGLVGHLYHYRMVAGNELGVHSGNDSVVAMHVERPQVFTLAAANVAPTSANFHGTVNPRERETHVWFEYGLTTKYGHLSPTAIVAGGPSTVPVGILVSDLSPWMSYHYRIVASNSVGVTTGTDMSVTLPGPSLAAPSLSALAEVTLPQGSSTSVSFSVSDPDTPVEQLVVRARANNPVLLPGITAGGVGPTRILTLAPDVNHSGSAVVTVTVSDATSTASRTFNFTVTPPAEFRSPILFLANAQAASAEAWRFHLVDGGTGSTNYVVEYSLDLSPTNSWLRATNVTDVGGGVFEVDTGPSQPGVGFYRVKGFRLLSGGLGLADLTLDEGAGVAGPVLMFNGPYVGTVSYTWTGSWGSSNGTVQVSGTTVVIPIVLTDNSGVDPLRTLTLRLEPGAGYRLAGITQGNVSIEENDADWQGTLIVPNGLAGTTTASLTNAAGGFTNVLLPQNANMVVGFTLHVQQSSGNFQGWMHSECSGYFPTSALAQLTLTENSFSAVATNIPLPPLTGSALFDGPHHLDLRLDAANTPGQTNVSPNRLSGTATMVSVLPGRPYLDSAMSGRFLLLKPPVFPSTNEVPLYPAQ